MLRFLQTLFWWICRFLLRFRYRVRVIGLEKLEGLRGPTLVMPSHPAYIDPPLVISHLRLRVPLRPIVTETMYRRAALYPLMRLVDALEVPDLAEHSHRAREQTLGMIDAVVAGLKRGESFLIYPAGRAERNGLEEIGGNRAVAEILQGCPETNVVLIRTRGVWGSMFSYARTGKSPKLGGCVLRALGWAVANLAFFLPKRHVTMTVEVVDRAKLPGLDREQLNPWLEAWYNQSGPETPTFVRYHPFFGPRDFRFPANALAEKIDLARIKPAAIQAVNEMVEEHLGRPLEDAEKQAHTKMDQIGLDSLDRMDISLNIEDRFGFHSDRVADTLGELWALAGGLTPQSDEGPKPAPEAWNRPASDRGRMEVLAETLAEAFVRRALLHADDVALADEVSGVLTYRRVLVGCELLSRRFRHLPGEAVGVLLPASVAADMVFFSLHMAGKLPVMLNWTTGPANLAHAVQKLGIRKVLTSRKLIDRLGIEVQGADYVFLEDLRSQIGKAEALLALASTYLAPGKLLARLPKQALDDPAVVLFTSGSESTPKAVPLTHRNLATNVQASLAVLQARPGDVLLAFLPPFHSFGLLGNVLAPLLAGIRAVYHPDPTDARALVRITAQYKASLLVTTPTFLGYMFGVATPHDLRSLRVIVTGAEKCPEALFARARELAPGATIIEGYGITECSPVVAGNRLDHNKPGTVGLPVDGVEVSVVDPDSKQPVPAGTTGMLLVRGPSVFGGYLAYEGPSPFTELGGKSWYVTGDLVRLDEDGFIHFSGRLKRFLKAGGEMISLPALEEPLAQRYPPTEDGPQVAVEGLETPDGRWIVLFTTQDIPLRQANAILTEAGFRGVMRLDDVVRLESIPVLGTGKTDYKVLRKMVAERV